MDDAMKSSPPKIVKRFNCFNVSRDTLLSVIMLHYISLSLSVCVCFLRSLTSVSVSLAICVLWQAWWHPCRRAGTASYWICRTASTRSSRVWARLNTAYILHMSFSHTNTHTCKLSSLVVAKLNQGRFWVCVPHIWFKCFMREHRSWWAHRSSGDTLKI